MRTLAMAARLRASSGPEVFQRCIEQYAAFANSADDAFLDHPLRFWVVDSVLVTTSALRTHELGDPRVEAALFDLVRKPRLHRSFSLGLISCLPRARRSGDVRRVGSRMPKCRHVLSRSFGFCSGLKSRKRSGSVCSGQSPVYFSNVSREHRRLLDGLRGGVRGRGGACAASRGAIFACTSRPSEAAVWGRSWGERARQASGASASHCMWTRRPWVTQACDTPGDPAHPPHRQVRAGHSGGRGRGSDPSAAGVPLRRGGPFSRYKGDAATRDNRVDEFPPTHGPGCGPHTCSPPLPMWRRAALRHHFTCCRSCVAGLAPWLAAARHSASDPFSSSLESSGTATASRNTFHN